MTDLYSDITPEYIVINMTDPSCAINRLYRDIAKLKFAIAHIDKLCKDNPFELDFRLMAAIKSAADLLEVKK